jgi:hypothetical protein
VAWSAPDDVGSSAITGYDVYCSSGTPSTADTPSATTDASTTSTTVSGLSTHTTYSCVVTAVNAFGPSVASDLVSAIPDSAPSVPTSFSTTSGNGSVTIYWDRPADVGGRPVTGYTAYCSTSYPPPIDTAHACGHFVGLTATNAVGESPPAGFGAPTPTGPPSRPWAVRTYAYAGSLVVRWKVPTSDGGSPIDGYATFCSTDDPPYTAIPVASSTNHVRIGGLTSGVPYYCVVVTVNEVGSSKPSLVVIGTPK